MPRPPCPFGAKCYRKNPEHFKHYFHPSDVSPARSPTRTVAAPSKLTQKKITMFCATTPAPAPFTDRPTVSPAPQPVPATERLTSPTRAKAVSASLKRQREPSGSASLSLSGLDSALAAPPAPRSSPLCGSPQEVYEMPFPLEDMKLVLQVASKVKAMDPLGAFEGIRLVGPFEILSGKKFASDSDKWTHYRFRYDPPEVQTFAVSVAESSPGVPQYHLAFHRDDPAEMPKMIVLGESTKPTFKIEGNNVGAVLAVHCPRESAALHAVFPKDTKRGEVIKARNKSSLARTFHGLGFAVPYDKKTEVGYRPPLLSHGELRSFLAKLNNNTLPPKQQEALDEQLQFADIANDECDFGLNIELGLNFFSMVEKRNEVAAHCYRILDTAYMLLGRSLFQHILVCHLPCLVSGNLNVVALS